MCAWFKVVEYDGSERVGFNFVFVVHVFSERGFDLCPCRVHVIEQGFPSVPAEFVYGGEYGGAGHGVL